jgi:hypothetical protein
MAMESKEVWRMRLRLEVGLLLRVQMMGFEVKEMKDLELAMPARLRRAMKGRTWMDWRQLSSLFFVIKR